MKAKSTFLAQEALPSPTLVPSSPHDDRSGLPTAASGGNISPERPVIRWMSYRLIARQVGPSQSTVGAILQRTRSVHHASRHST